MAQPSPGENGYPQPRVGRRGPDSLTRERDPHGGGILLSHPRPLESSPALPTGWSLGWQMGSYLFFFLMYKTCKRRSSIKWPGKEALINPAVPWDRGHAEADERENYRSPCPQRPHPRDTYILNLCFHLTFIRC